MESKSLMERVLKTTEIDYCTHVHWGMWDGEMAFWVPCSDVFAWGGSDAERLTEENIALFEQTYQECKQIFDEDSAFHAGILFVARLRGMRPQGAWYNQELDFGDDEDLKWVELFNSVGPPREVRFGNPRQQKDER